MRLAVKGGAYVVGLTVAQTNLIRGSLLVLTELEISPERMIVQFGCQKSDLDAMVERLNPITRTGAELDLTPGELRMIYLALWQVPEMFGSEEAFHTRLGFFTEETRGLARELLAAVDRAA
ncbi:hypothetical protein [Krasilnikovia sp. MM14-A1259]|uniref:hypothetical protein n=1 Tax=Krasilnikovia sp. MM14-A1259 TaxID=3373539 RepID=UPI003809C81D